MKFNWRKIIISAVGILILVAAYVRSESIAASKEALVPVEQKIVTKILAEEITNSNHPIQITASGQLAARNRMDIYAEVQGIFEKSDRLFKTGVYYRKGDLLVGINKQEHYANLQAQKSNLYNQIIAIMPDLKLDYPAAYPQWSEYLAAFDMNRSVKELPKSVTEREKLFISGKNIFSNFYSLRNLEVRLQKHNIYAPFGGVLTETSVEPGTLVRAGQKIASMIDPSVYELEVALNVSLKEFLTKGKEVELHDINRTTIWKGKVVRINPVVNPSTQTLSVFIEVRDKDLQEGMYLEADLPGKLLENVTRISRKLLVENGKIFIVEEDRLSLLPVEPVFFEDKTVIVSGIPDGTRILSKAVPGAYDGMPVEILQSNQVKN